MLIAQSTRYNGMQLDLIANAVHTVAILWVQDRSLLSETPCPPIDSIITLMTVWRITGKIIRTIVIVNYICT